MSYTEAEINNALRIVQEAFRDGLIEERDDESGTWRTPSHGSMLFYDDIAARGRCGFVYRAKRRPKPLAYRVESPEYGYLVGYTEHLEIARELAEYGTPVPHNIVPLYAGPLEGDV